MKLFVIMIMLTALYLLYRIAFPKSPEAKTGSDIPPDRETDADDCVKKSRYVSACRRQPQPTPAMDVNSDCQVEKPSIFASRNEKTDAVIPPGKLGEVFGEDPGPEDLDIEPDDENETGSPDGEEESEELRQTLGGDVEPAGGFSVEEMEEAARAVDKPSGRNAAILFRVEKTDLFEQLVSGDEGKAARIKALIDSHIRSLNLEVENEERNSDPEDFDMMEFLS